MIGAALSWIAGSKIGRTLAIVGAALTAFALAMASARRGGAKDALNDAKAAAAAKREEQRQEGYDAQMDEREAARDGDKRAILERMRRRDGDWRE